MSRRPRTSFSLRLRASQSDENCNNYIDDDVLYNGGAMDSCNQEEEEDYEAENDEYEADSDDNDSDDSSGDNKREKNFELRFENGHDAVRSKENNDSSERMENKEEELQEESDYWHNDGDSDSQEGEYYEEEEKENNDDVIREERSSDARTNNPKKGFVCESFNINDDIKKVAKASANFVLPDDDEVPLFQNSSMTKGRFAREIRFLLQKNHVSLQCETDLLILLNNCFNDFTDHRLPVRRRKRREKIYYSSEINNYLPPANEGLFRYDICRKGCVPFVGEYKDVHNCPVCRAERFYPCHSCLENDKPNCTHKLQDRRPYKFIQYRSLTTLFIELIKQPGFIFATQYRNKDSFKRKEDGTANKMRDEMDTPSYDRAMETMNQYKELFFQTNPHYSEIEYIYVPIIISIFYDGVQLFKSKYYNFKPLIVWINNLPPSQRVKFSVGTFLLSLFSSVKHSNVEKFLFSDCLIKELIALLEGQLHCINGKYYFIQAILNKHVVDTKELEDYIGTSVIGTLQGCCFCDTIHGYWRHDLDKVTHPGHRHLLELTNALRARGQSKVCCPLHYYSKNNNVFVPLVQKKDAKDIVASTITPITVECLKFYEKTRFAESICGGEDAKQVAKTTKKYTFHHSNEIDFKKIEKYLYYHHFDYRAQKTYVRYSNAVHLANSKTEWVFSSLYPPASISKDIGFDSMHAAKNIIGNMEKNISGERIQEKHADYNLSLQCHPSSYIRRKQLQKEKESDDEKALPTKNNKRKKAPPPACKGAVYIASKSKRNKADGWINAIMVPSGHKQNFQIQHFFRRSGFLRVESMLKWCINLMDFTMSAFDDYSEEYKEFFAMVSMDFAEIFSPLIDVKEIMPLFYKWVETCATHEGMFPESESLIPWHQLVDCVQQMKHFGPLPLWWAFSGERVNGIIKRFVPRGGTSLEKVVFDRVLRLEKITIQNAYNFTAGSLTKEYFKHDIINPSPGEKHFTVRKVEGKDTLFYSDEIFVLHKNITISKAKKLNKHSVDDKGIIFTTEEMNSLIETICTNVRKRCKSISECLINCRLFRLQWYCERDDLAIGKSFMQWANDLLKLFTVHKTLNPSWELTQEFDWELVKEDFDDFETYLEETKVFTKNDLWFLFEIVSEGFACRMFSAATIFGVKFKSRGFDCKEKSTTPTVKDIPYGTQNGNNGRYWPDNPKNKLKYHWHKKKSYSSWAKIRCNIKTSKDNQCGVEDYNNKKNYLYGQFNFFIQLYFPKDSFINNFNAASVTLRNHTTINRVDYIIADNDGNSYFPQKLFVALDDVYSTPIMNCAFKTNYYKADKFLEQLRNKEQVQILQEQQQNRVRTKRVDLSKKNKELLIVDKTFTTSKVVETEIKNMIKANPVPYYINGLATENENDFVYTPFENRYEISYLVVLEMERNRQNIKYYEEKDADYREEVFGSMEAAVRVKVCK